MTAQHSVLPHSLTLIIILTITLTLVHIDANYQCSVIRHYINYHFTTMYK